VHEEVTEVGCSVGGDICFVLSCLVLSCLVLSCLVLSCLVLSCFVLFLFCFVLVTPEGITTIVANKGLEKARAYFKPGPRRPMA